MAGEGRKKGNKSKKYVVLLKDGKRYVVMENNIL
jgi:hypothetical protein